MQSLLDTYFFLLQARLAQSVERQALNLVVGGSSPPVGASFCVLFLFLSIFSFHVSLYYYCFFLLIPKCPKLL